MEQWRINAIKQGERALERLRGCVKQAINALGTGFLRHPANDELRQLPVPGIGGLFERITHDQDGQPIEPTLPDAFDEPLEGLLLPNEALITAVRHLTIVESDSQRRPVDFRNLGSEDLGSVYESLLELHASYDPLEQTFTLVAAAGNERKETGSYCCQELEAGRERFSTGDRPRVRRERTGGHPAVAHTHRAAADQLGHVTPPVSSTATPGPGKG